MLNKRGQGLSITVIIAAVIGLIIIVVIVAMLTGKFKKYAANRFNIFYIENIPYNETFK